MKKLLYIEGSPRKDRSHSIKIANEYLKKVAENDNNIEIKTIDLWSLDLPEFNGDMMNAKYDMDKPLFECFADGGKTKISNVKVVKLNSIWGN